MDALYSDAVTVADEADKADSRTAEGSAAELPGKTATTDWPVRFTAPSIVAEGLATRTRLGDDALRRAA